MYIDSFSVVPSSTISTTYFYLLFHVKCSFFPSFFVNKISIIINRERQHSAFFTQVTNGLFRMRASDKIDSHETKFARQCLKHVYYSQRMIQVDYTQLARTMREMVQADDRSDIMYDWWFFGYIDGRNAGSGFEFSLTSSTWSTIPLGYFRKPEAVREIENHSDSHPY